MEWKQHHPEGGGGGQAAPLTGREERKQHHPNGGGGKQHHPEATPPTWRCQEGNSNPREGERRYPLGRAAFPLPLSCRALPSCFFLVVPPFPSFFCVALLSVLALVGGAAHCLRLHASLFFGVGRGRGGGGGGEGRRREGERGEGGEVLLLPWVGLPLLLWRGAAFSPCSVGR